jgi:glycerophosphoryl diester phosphodiesterase
LLDGSCIPLLEDALKLVADKSRLQIEFKSRESVLPTIAILNKHGMIRQTLMTSFSHGRLALARIVSKEAMLGVLTVDDVNYSISAAKDLGAHSVHLSEKWLTQKTAEHLHHRGLCIHCWNTNSRRRMRELMKLGADGIGSDSPALLYAFRRESADYMQQISRCLATHTVPPPS